jgi:thiol-disulfide isomerase/thioredoxin
MKKIIAGLALLLASTFTLSAQEYANNTISVGQQAPELEFPNPAGENLKLSELNKGRVILLDFWASWCGPCRRASPELVALYEKYKNEKFNKAKNGFTVVSVSLDKDKAAWVKAIADDNLSWPYHMSDLGAWQSKGAQIYGVQFIPQAFLIGPDGKIIGKYMTPTAAVADLDKMLKKKKSQS